MSWLTLVTLLVVLQYFFFGVLVSRARIVHGVPAPSMAGNAEFERMSRRAAPRRIDPQCAARRVVQ